MTLSMRRIASGPVLGPALFQHTPLTYLALALVAVTAYVFYRTPLGLALRTVGENPAAVEAQGFESTATTWESSSYRRVA